MLPVINNILVVGRSSRLS